MKKKVAVIFIAMSLVGMSFYAGWLDGKKNGKIEGYRELRDLYAQYNLNYLGKTLTIHIPDDIIIDAEYIRKVCDDEINYKGADIPEPFFDLFIPSEIDRLINYMTIKNYKIKPGLYDLQTNMTAENIIALLEFSSL